ncbi:MAG: hypothetical protein BWZ10_01520 [candidate division BRC1 bacterium ADurb.BinA364]|nr:MAG: hypothetical protein BWZ10_01520 [candidate division BRC1 bacterium ADurb.BinA364]
MSEQSRLDGARRQSSLVEPVQRTVAHVNQKSRVVALDQRRWPGAVGIVLRRAGAQNDGEKLIAILRHGSLRSGGRFALLLVNVAPRACRLVLRKIAGLAFETRPGGDCDGAAVAPGCIAPEGAKLGCRERGVVDRERAAVSRRAILLESAGVQIENRVFQLRGAAGAVHRSAMAAGAIAAEDAALEPGPRAIIEVGRAAAPARLVADELAILIRRFDADTVQHGAAVFRPVALEAAADETQPRAIVAVRRRAVARKVARENAIGDRHRKAGRLRRIGAALDAPPVGDQAAALSIVSGSVGEAVADDEAIERRAFGAEEHMIAIVGRDARRADVAAQNRGMPSRIAFVTAGLGSRETAEEPGARKQRERRLPPLALGAVFAGSDPNFGPIARGVLDRGRQGRMGAGPGAAASGSSRGMDINDPLGYAD